MLAVLFIGPGLAGLEAKDPCYSGVKLSWTVLPANQPPTTSHKVPYTNVVRLSSSLTETTTTLSCTAHDAHRPHNAPPPPTPPRLPAGVELGIEFSPHVDTTH